MGSRVIRLSLKEELFQALEELSRVQRRSHAALIREACHLYLLQIETDQLEKEYVERHQLIPKDPAVGQGQVAILGQVLSADNW